MSLMSRLEDAVEFAENPEPRCPCVLLLDTSGSMQGEPLEAMLEGLEAFRFDLAVDPLAARRVEVAVIAFDNRIQLVQDWTSPDRFEVPPLTAQGLTHIGEAINKALDLVEERKATYRAFDVAYYRPWVFLVTDGEPQGETDDEVIETMEAVSGPFCAMPALGTFSVTLGAASVPVCSTVAGLCVIDAAPVRLIWPPVCEKEFVTVRLSANTLPAFCV